MAIADKARTGTDPEPKFAYTQLLSKDYEEILNLVDKLRSEGISKYVDVPQIIVCGDQSSGKSSVLGAISGVTFPWRDNICTRFAIELILRHSTESHASVSIYPDEDRPPGEQQRLKSFQSPTVALDQFNDIVNKAETFIGIGQNGVRFSKDVLRVEVSGPSQPHLTLVDLPGLYHAADENQDEEGVQFVESLVLSYMQKRRSVILAVVSAKSDIALQKVTSFTRKVDPNGERTIGIITKPDTLSQGSDMEQSFVKLARNERVKFQLGWHVLKNRSFEERNFSIEERHAAESNFFEKGIWSTLPRSQIGIDPLRPRLSKVLKDHILAQMPSFIHEINTSLEYAEVDLRKLGEARGTTMQQRRYLMRSSELFGTLIGHAVNGIYFDPFFGDAMTKEGFERRLRAVIQNRLSDFADTMRSRGEARQIVEDDAQYVGEGTVPRITMSEYVQEVKQRMRRSRGQELPGTFNPLIIGELFYLQSRPWEQIVTDCIEQMLLDARKTTMSVMQEVLDRRTVDGLCQHVINECLTKIEQKLHEKTRELLTPQQKGHPITYNYTFVEQIQQTRARHFRESVIKNLRTFFGRNYPTDPLQKQQHTFSMIDLISALGGQDEEEMELFACTEAINCMQAFYKVARKKFVDDFSNLAVEFCLLEPLLSMFTPSKVESLEDAVVHDIAHEDENTVLERERLQKKVTTLQSCLTILRRMDRPNIMMVNHDADSVDGFHDINHVSEDVESDKLSLLDVDDDVASMTGGDTQDQLRGSGVLTPELIPQAKMERRGPFSPIFTPAPAPAPEPEPEPEPTPDSWLSSQMVAKKKKKHAKARLYETTEVVFD